MIGTGVTKQEQPIRQAICFRNSAVAHLLFAWVLVSGQRVAALCCRQAEKQRTECLKSSLFCMEKLAIFSLVVNNTLAFKNKETINPKHRRVC